MKTLINTLIAIAVVAGMQACKERKFVKTETVNTDSAIIARANYIGDSIAKATAKPDTTNRIDTARILKNPNYAFVHDCYLRNCQQMQIIRYGMVNGFDKKIKLSSKKMMSDYEALRSRLTDYAIRNNIPLSTDTLLDLSYTNSMDGYTWDSTWVDLVLKDQGAMLNDFQQAEKTVNDEQLLSIIKDHVPAINKHLEIAANLKKSY